MLINLIVAIDQTGGISKNGYIPWHCRADMKRFAEITTVTKDPTKQNAVIMGRKTFETIGKELPKRHNYILSNSLQEIKGYTSVEKVEQRPFEALFNEISGRTDVERVFVIGGESIYRQVLEWWSHKIDKIYVTELKIDAHCTQRFPVNFLREQCNLVYEQALFDSGIHLLFKEYTVKNVEEQQYLTLLQKIMKEGDHRIERTGVGVRSLFGLRMEFDIEDRLPLLTTKKVFWKTILRELLWFISGSTDATVLQKQGVRIWDGNTTREFLDSRGLTQLPVGDIGEGYGFNWRHFGAEYIDCHTDYTGRGKDQLAEIVRLIREEPTSRRILLSAWNPLTLHKAALPPCHVLCQFYVRSGRLDCQMYQRSGDMALGVPFNIASYSMLTYMIASVTGLKPGRFIHIIGDAHIYDNHVVGVQEQLKRAPYSFPTMQIKTTRNSLFDFVEDDFELEGYQSHATIQLKMAV